MGSKYKLGNLFLNSGYGCASTLPENIFGHFLGTIARCLAGILTGWETMILPSMTACEATAMTSLLYSANHLLPSVHPNLKQWWLKNSLPKMKDLVIPSQTTNLWVMLQGPILKLTTIEPFTPMSWPLAVLIQILLSDIWFKSPSAATLSYLKQLTCAPVLNSDENTWSCTFILNVVPLVFPVFIKKIPLFLLHCHLCSHFHSPLLVRLMNFPIFWSFCSCPTLLLLFPFGPQWHQRPGLDHLQ